MSHSHAHAFSELQTPTPHHSFIVFGINPSEEFSSRQISQSQNEACNFQKITMVRQCLARTVAQTTVIMTPATAAAVATTTQQPRLLHGMATTTKTTAVERPPNRFTTYVTRMKETCPDVMKQYATCVLDEQEAGTTLHRACETEFRAVKECFRLVRG